MLEYDKELRIDNQYYLKNRKVIVNYDNLRDLILKMKEIINTISNEKIAEIRKKIKELIQGP